MGWGSRLAVAPSVVVDDPIERLLADYTRYLLDERALTERTVGSVRGGWRACLWRAWWEGAARGSRGWSAAD